MSTSRAVIPSRSIFRSESRNLTDGEGGPSAASCVILSPSRAAPALRFGIFDASARLRRSRRYLRLCRGFFPLGRALEFHVRFFRRRDGGPFQSRDLLPDSRAIALEPRRAVPRCQFLPQLYEPCSDGCYLRVAIHFSVRS